MITQKNPRPTVFASEWKALWGKIKYPVLLLLGMRFGLSIGFAVIGYLADPFITSPEFLAERGLELLPRAPTLLGRLFIDVWLRWDAVNFLHVANEGYSASNSYYFAFYPLFPILARIFSSLIVFDVPRYAAILLSGLLISTLATGVSLLSLRALILDCYQDIQLANWTIFVWVIFPTSFFLFAPFSDALFISLAVTTLFALKRKKWILAGVLASFAGLARAQGILLFVPITLAIFESTYQGGGIRWFNRKNIITLASSLAPASMGWVGFNIWSRIQASNNLLTTYSDYWSFKLADPITVLIQTLKFIWYTWNIRAISEVSVVFLFSFLILWMASRRKYRKDYFLLGYTIITFLSFTVWYHEWESGYLSSNRYVLSLFPAFIALGELLLKLPPWLRTLVAVLSVVLLLITSMFFVRWEFIG